MICKKWDFGKRENIHNAFCKKPLLGLSAGNELNRDRQDGKEKEKKDSLLSLRKDRERKKQNQNKKERRKERKKEKFPNEIESVEWGLSNPNHLLDKGL